MTALPWYIARSAGLVAWALLTASVVWGLVMSTRSRPFGHRPRPAWMLDLHRWLGGLATIFVGVHVLALLADSYVHFTLLSVLVPFAGSWRPAAVAWGVVGLYLLLAVELTSLARRRLPKRAWRAVHFASFPLFLLATAHALTAGTDAGSWAFVTAATTSVLGVAALTAKRIADSTRVPEPDAGGARARVTAARRATATPARIPTGAATRA
ncbi:MAG TPA: ferric reductase-like transmembrane domain-containing protein [Acidimicrobiales bacterium]|nr:ferric reductase-like transmembrane domain-containing protein [Acidimicrobiales bacterium]